MIEMPASQEEIPELSIACPYCGGSLCPYMERENGYAHSDYEKWVSTECEDCGAEWNRDGSSKQKPYYSTLKRAITINSEGGTR